MPWLLILEFLGCSALIVFAGIKLSRYGDVIAEKLGLGRAWVGLVLMASITSLPELINGISSVTIADVPDIAVGDIMGSSIFNIAIIAAMDFFHRPGPVFASAYPGHVLSAGFGIVLIGIACISVLVSDQIPAIGTIGLYTPVILAVYFIGIRSIYYFEKRRIAEIAGEITKATIYDDVPLNKAVKLYALNAGIIILSATALPFIGEALADATGLGKSFVGTFFIGITTSLPEVVVSLACIRIGATDMAIANLFGSNMFNICILAVDDILYTKGPLLSAVSKNHAVSGFTAMVITGMAVVALTYRIKSKTFLRLGWDAIAILATFFASIALLYALRGSG
ncbi:MAG: sodium:calcium antiporter [Deltaproteobacteria bacterium]|nr:sodium:calcium antiporter [Deltaproteobacteria bacterium]